MEASPAALPRDGSRDDFGNAGGGANTSSLMDWCKQHFAEAADEVKEKLTREGYKLLEELKEDFSTRAEWLAFALERAGLPYRGAQKCACEFGPDLPVPGSHTDRQDRLKAELAAWFGGDFDNKHAFQEEGSKEQRYEFHFLLHDTSGELGRRIMEEGLLRARGADDTHYDGKLAFATAPDVVFFQASHGGSEGSIYPRAYGGKKLRFCVPPYHLALHTDVFKMYFVSITPPRQGQGESRTRMLQMHCLFIRSNHPKISYCDEHFLLVNKANFQPFQYSSDTRMWYGYGDKTSRAFHGRGVKVNIAVAEDIPMWYTEKTSIEDMWKNNYYPNWYGIIVELPPSKLRDKQGSVLWKNSPSEELPQVEAEVEVTVQSFMSSKGLSGVEAERQQKESRPCPCGIALKKWPLPALPDRQGDWYADETKVVKEIVTELCRLAGVTVSSSKEPKLIISPGSSSMQEGMVLALLDVDDEVDILVRAVNGS